MLIHYALAFCRIAIGLTFAFSCGTKVLRLTAFQQTIFNFQLLPASLVRPAAYLFVLCEALVPVLMLIGGGALWPGFLLALLLLITFSMALLAVLRRHMQTSCNCFGASERAVAPIDLWRNAGFLLCTLCGCAALLVTAHSQVYLDWTAWSTLALAACVFVLLWSQLGELVQLLQQR